MKQGEIVWSDQLHWRLLAWLGPLTVPPSARLVGFAAHDFMLGKLLLVLFGFAYGTDGAQL
jgi:hypothetical protein